MAILLNVVGYENKPWLEVLRRELPDLPVYEPEQVPNPAEILYAAVWHHPHDELQNYPNLKAIFNLGAGADHIDTDPALSHFHNVPVVRLIDPDVGIDMAHYALYWSMHFQRGFERYRQQATARHWRRFMRPRACEWRVTVLGLGRIGEYIAEQIQQVGFIAQAWNRSPKQLDGVRVFAGYEQLNQALSESDVVINCLPLNDQTTNLLDDERLGAMPEGSHLISISRGAVLREESLIAQIQAGRIAGAALDCFHTEPLPADSLLWSLPNVHITPHMSGATFARTAALVVVDNIQRMEQGDAPFPIHRMT